jgi:glycosyltransferase involved in cell wall biosynthesis
MTANGAALPRVSIVVPSYNQGRFLRQALDSIFRQDYPAVEVIAMDGGSTDDSVAILRAYADRLAYWRSGPDGGQSAAINEGMRHATGDIVAWLNSDDFHWGDCLWTVADAWVRFPEHGLYVGNGFRYEDRKQHFSPFQRRHLALNRQALIHGLDYVLQPATFFSRRAWEEVGGLDPSLRYGLDWDVMIRVARRYPAVLVNEFLAVSREYDETKTRSGKLARALELCELSRRHGGGAVTGGGLHYLFNTLLSLGAGDLDDCLAGGLRRIEERWQRDFGHPDGFPVIGDPQDRVYLPLPAAVRVRRPLTTDGAALPTVSVVCTGPAGSAALDETLASVRQQQYPRVDLVLADSGRRGEAAAVNGGLATARGTVLGWLRAGDLLGDGALRAIGAAFSDDPELDLVYGNALYLDEENRPRLVDEGGVRTAFCYGEAQPVDRLPEYWRHRHLVPQPTIFFRKRLLQQAGGLDESYRRLFDVEWWGRFARTAKVRKREKTLALCRRSAEEGRREEWERRAEWYRFSRSRWPGPLAPGWSGLLGGFVRAYVRERFGPRARGPRGLAMAAAVAAAAVLRVGNPERWRVGERAAP